MPSEKVGKVFSLPTAAKKYKIKPNKVIRNRK